MPFRAADPFWSAATRRRFYVSTKAMWKFQSGDESPHSKWKFQSGDESPHSK